MRRGFGWGQARRASVVFSEVPDDTLSEWAIASDARALTELHHRYAGIAGQFAAVVSGRPQEAAAVVASAFTVTLSELVDDAPAISDPFLPRLLRSVRTLALVGADKGVDAAQLAASVGPGTSPALLAEVFSGLTEPERSALWLSEVAELSSADAGLALAVVGGTSTLRWTRPRSVGLDALVQRANTTLGDHRAGAVTALAAVDAPLYDGHLDALVAEWPRRRSWVSRWSRPSLDWNKIIGERDASFGRIARLAVLLLLVVVSLAVVLNRRDTGTAQSGLPAKHVGSGGSANGASSQGTGGESSGTPRANPASPTGVRQRGSSGSAGGSGNGSSSRTGSNSTNSGNRSGTKGGGGSAPRAIGLSAASGTTVGVGTSSTGSQAPSSGTGNPTPPSGGATPTTAAAPPSGGPGGGPGPTSPPPTTPSPTTQPPVATPTTAPPTTAPPSTDPPTTEPTTTAPPTTDPPTTDPPTTQPGPTEPPTTDPPTTLPPVP